MALAIVILVLLLTLSFFYLKCSLMQSLSMLWSAVIATIIAFSFYEAAAQQFLTRGYALDWAQFGCFLAVYIISFALLRMALDYLVPMKIDLGDPVKIVAAVVCGLLTGVILSGNLLVAMGLLPRQGKIFYSRFDPDAPVVLKQPRTPALKADGFVTGLYSRISSGSMSSGKSFGVLHADYLAQIHLNKLKTKDQILTVCSQDALVLPRDKNQKPIRLQMDDDEEVLIVRAGIRAKKITDGGANNASGKIEFFPAQIRLIVKEANAAVHPMAQTATAMYPIGLWKSGKVIEWELNEIVTPDSKGIRDRVYWMDVAFQDPKGKKPVLLEFKQNAVVDLSPYEVVKNTPEIEQALNDEGQKKGSP